MKYKGIIKGSRTLDVSAIATAIGAAIATLPQLQAFIEPEHYGYLIMGLSVLNAYLRKITSQPLDDKS